MCRMQEMGSPPEEVMGEMPEGLVSRQRRKFNRGLIEDVSS